MTKITDTDSNCSSNNINNNVNNNKTDNNNKKNIPFSKPCNYCSKPIVRNNDKQQYEDKDGGDNQWIKHKCKTGHKEEQTRPSSSSIEFTTASQLLLDNDIASLLNKNIEFANRYSKQFQFELVVKEAGKSIMHNSDLSNGGPTKK